MQRPCGERDYVRMRRETGKRRANKGQSSLCVIKKGTTGYNKACGVIRTLMPYDLFYLLF